MIAYLKKFDCKAKKCFLTHAYHSPSQSHKEFEIFCTYFGILLSQINYEFPICSIATEDFNARCTYWKDDFNNLTSREIDSLTSSARYIQTIDKFTRYK